MRNLKSKKLISESFFEQSMEDHKYFKHKVFIDSDDTVMKK